MNAFYDGDIKGLQESQRTGRPSLSLNFQFHEEFGGQDYHWLLQ